MQRYSLYIDHQLVSTLIRELEAIVQTCYQELDEEYETHQLRTHIYEEFVFHITALHNSKYAIKHEHHELKDDELKKYYELTSKLEGIGAHVKYEEVLEFQKIAKKGRPTKNQQVEDHLVNWVREKMSTQGKLNFTKKELDEVYLPFLKENKPRNFPTNNYFRIFKKYDILEISITNRNGTAKTVRQFFDKKNLSQSFCKKEDEFGNIILMNEHEINEESDLNSTSELEGELYMQYECYRDSKLMNTKSSKFTNQAPFGWKPKSRSCKVKNSKKEKKAEKRMEKSMKMKNFFNDDFDLEGIDNQWDEMSISNELFEKVEPNPEIYDNSKSF